MRRVLFVALVATVRMSAPALAQTTTPAAQLAANAPSGIASVPAAQVTTAMPADEATPFPVDAYSYRPDGRRDPFVSLMGVGTESRPVGKPADGPAAFSVNEISVRGVIQSREALVAMVQGPDNRTYIMHSGDKFADGVVKNVTPQGLVVLQDVSDPLSTQKQREVRKLLRSLEDAK